MNAVVDELPRTWTDIFAESGQRYEEATLAVFEGQTQTACGRGSAATGPFYCPADSQIYLDLGFFRELRDRFGAPGDFAQAYVIAHEYGHHVQNLLGINGEVQRIPEQTPTARTRCPSGWSCRPIAPPASGATPRSTCRLLRATQGRPRCRGSRRRRSDSGEATGRVDPESWTHGSSKQRSNGSARVRLGDGASCDTFQADPL